MVVFLNYVFPLDSEGIEMGIALVDIMAWLPLMHQAPPLEIQGPAVT